MKLGKVLGAAAAAVLALGIGLQAQAADPIKIGVYLPLTGQNAFGGQLELEGVQLARKLTPTVLDRPVELVIVDNKSDKVEAANAVKRLTERDKVLAIIGTYGSSLAMAGGEVAERAKVPVIGTSCTNPLVTQGKKYYFRACFIDPYQGAAAATYAFKNLGFKKGAVLTDVANDYAVGLSAFCLRIVPGRRGLLSVLCGYCRVCFHRRARLLCFFDCRLFRLRPRFRSFHPAVFCRPAACT